MIFSPSFLPTGNSHLYPIRLLTAIEAIFAFSLFLKFNRAARPQPPGPTVLDVLFHVDDFSGFLG